MPEETVGQQQPPQLPPWLLLQPQPSGPTASDIVPNVDIQRFLRYVFGDRIEVEEGEEELNEPKSIKEAAEALARDLVEPYVRDGLARIMHPVYGAKFVDTRLMETVRLLRTAVRIAWRQVREALDTGKPPREVARLARRAWQVSRLAKLVTVKVYEKLVTMLHVNAPAAARPPLATLTLGYDMLRIKESSENEKSKT